MLALLAAPRPYRKKSLDLGGRLFGLGIFILVVVFPATDLCSAIDFSAWPLFNFEAENILGLRSGIS